MSDERLKKLEGILEQLIEEGLWASGEIGIHPAAWTDYQDPTNNYTQRTPEMEEHNKKAMSFLQTIIKAHKILRGE